MGAPHSSSTSNPLSSANTATGSVAFQGTLDISNYVDDSEDTTDTGSATSSTAGGIKGASSGAISALSGRASSYHLGHGGSRSSGLSNTKSAKSNFLSEDGAPNTANLPPTAMTIASAAAEERKKLSIVSSGTGGAGEFKGSPTSLITAGNIGAVSAATIVNLEENKVKIKVPGLQQKSQPQHSSVAKQKSMNP